jgi:hypothetical protein
MRNPHITSKGTTGGTGGLRSAPEQVSARTTRHPEVGLFGVKLLYHARSVEMEAEPIRNPVPESPRARPRRSGLSAQRRTQDNVFKLLWP